jgi:NitT/TauT family transport system substrate-binding protein
VAGFRTRPSAIVLLAAGLLAACGPSSSPAASAGASEAVHLRLGYNPNVTHATAIVGIEQGILADKLGSGVVLEPQAFNAGPDIVEAIFSGALDASYVGPNPAINAFTRSNGTAIRIIAGSTSGGAALVVRDGIDTPQDLVGTTLASPQLGNTQDVALRAWLAEQGLTTDLQGGGDVSIQPQANGQALEAFVGGHIDGAWVPEPWATRMVEEGGGTVLVDERDLWPGGQFVTTHLVVATAFLEAHPDVVKRLLEGHVEANSFVNEHADEAQAIVGAAIADLTGAELPASTLAAAWEHLTFTVDPIASSLAVSAAHAKALGLLDNDDLEGIYDLTMLNDVLAEAGLPGISTP